MARATFPVSFTIAIPGARALTVALSRYKEEIRDFTEFYNDYLAPTWYALMVKRYASQGSFGGERWARLTPDYAAWKRKFYPMQPVGVLTGATRAALTSPFSPGAVYKADSQGFVVGTRLNYPIWLQLGTRRMRARPPIAVTNTLMREIGRLLQRYAVDIKERSLS